MTGAGPGVGLTLFVVAVLAALVTLAWRRAVRIDRLHLDVLAARTTLAALLERRAHAVRALALSGTLDPAGAVVLADAAAASLDAADAPLVTDGLDAPTRTGLAEATADRVEVERHLGNALGQLLDAPTRTRLAGDPRSREALARLDAAAYRLAVVASVHETRVDQVRRARAPWLVRALHLAGHAPIPAHVPADLELDAAGTGSGTAPGGGTA